MKYLVLFVMALLTAVLRIRIIYDIWTWHIAPLGAPSITFVHAFVFMLLWHLISERFTSDGFKENNKKSDLGPITQTTIANLGHVLAVWGIAWWLV